MKGSFLALYKPLGISSFKYISQFKRENNIKKIGHMGTLDPLAEGILPVATEEATRLIQYAYLLPKIYECEIYFGVESPTLDREPFLDENGEIQELPKITQGFIKSNLEAKLKLYLGLIDQRPPIFSAVHVNGKRAYDLARKGNIEQSQIKSRKVECFAIELLEFEWPIAKIRLEVGKGFYVRSLVRDLSRDLDVPAFMYSLRRLQVGVFASSDNMKDQSREVSWQEVLKTQIIIDITKEEYHELRNGRFIKNCFEFDTRLLNNENPLIVFAKIGQDLVSVLQLDRESNMLRPKNNFTL